MNNERQPITDEERVDKSMIQSLSTKSMIMGVAITAELAALFDVLSHGVSEVDLLATVGGLGIGFLTAIKGNNQQIELEERIDSLRRQK